MSISIKHKPIDLMTFEVTTPIDELIALDEIQGQIKKCLINRKVKPNEIETLLINKIVYYSVREIQKTNPLLNIPMGWYKYGPCFERMRTKELEMYEFNISRKTNDPIKEIINNCKSETPMFLKSRKIRDTPKGMYFYDYLKHIYSERVDFKHLKPFYQSKHELAHETYLQTFSEKNIANKTLIRKFFEFNKAICNKEYIEMVGLESKLINQVEDNLNTFLEILIANNDLRNKNELDPRIEAHSKHMVVRFEDITLGIFAYKNYKATFNDLDEEKDQEKKIAFEKQIQNNLRITRYLLEENLNLLEKINGWRG